MDTTALILSRLQFAFTISFHIIFPADYTEAGQAIEAAARTAGPFYIRTLRPKTAVIYDDSYRFQLGRWDKLRDGHDVTLIACGELVKAALDAAETLAGEGVQARVLNAASLRPMDREALLAAAAETGAIVTAEDHFVLGGLGSLVATTVAEAAPVPVEYVGMRDRYGTSGTWEQLLEHFGFQPCHPARAPLQPCHPEREAVARGRSTGAKDPAGWSGEQSAARRMPGRRAPALSCRGEGGRRKGRGARISGARSPFHGARPERPSLLRPVRRLTVDVAHEVR